MPHKIYKVVNLVYHTQQHGRQRQRISIGLRHPDFTTIYPVAKWITIPVGFSFVFVDEDAAWSFYYQQREEFPSAELWLCESEDEPRHLTGMAKRWALVPQFWEACKAGDVEMLKTMCIPCPDSYYGVKTLRLFSKID